MMIRSIPIAVVLLFALGAQAQDGLTQDVLFKSGQYGYHTYRIPALIVTKQGTVIAFCEGRVSSGSDQGNIDMMMKSSRNNGKGWTKYRKLYEEGRNKAVTIGNPCPVVDQSTGLLWLTFCRNNKEVLVMYSRDDGRTWSRPKNISKGVVKKNWSWVATGPGVGIQLQRGKHKGRLVIPCDHGIPIKGKQVMFSHVMYSDDHGKTWKLGGSADRHTDECQVIEKLDGTLVLNMRNYWGRQGGRPDLGGKRAIATSRDGGLSWSKLSFDKTLIEPICQASLIQYGKPIQGAKNPLIFCNPANTSRRNKMTIRLSLNEGKTWAHSRLLHRPSSAYSCLTVLPDGTVGCLYESDGYKNIRFARFPISWIMKK